ncbi:hypothetical protein [uncultured Bilophila sp.]|nr:hypothetical protein [uncultured Bilophila sp.]
MRDLSFVWKRFRMKRFFPVATMTLVIVGLGVAQLQHVPVPRGLR